MNKYPYDKIDVGSEQKKLLATDIVVLQFPTNGTARLRPWA